MNVIVVDWTDLSKWGYFSASDGSSRYVAAAIHDVIQRLVTEMGITSDRDEYRKFLIRMLLMGHSMGAHICGLVGELLTNSYSQANTGRTEKRLGTIVAIDPAGPLVPPFGQERHCVKHNDARRVLVLHTSKTFGNLYRLGHEDYYANGGHKVVPSFSTPGLGHLRAVNLIRALIWYEATGYYNITGRDFKSISFTLTVIPDKESPIIPYPIYLPTNLNSPYFNNSKPKNLSIYRLTTTTKNGWDKIKFDSDGK